MDRTHADWPISFSQASPSKPLAHWQVRRMLPWFTQVAPFWQGSSWHGSRSWMQLQAQYTLCGCTPSATYLSVQHGSRLMNTNTSVQWTVHSMRSVVSSAGSIIYFISFCLLISSHHSMKQPPWRSNCDAPTLDGWLPVMASKRLLPVVTTPKMWYDSFITTF